MEHTVKITDTDEAVIVTRTGEELHLTTSALALLMESARLGNDMMADDAHDYADDDPDRQDKIDNVSTVDEWLQWTEHNTAVVFSMPLTEEA